MWGLGIQSLGIPKGTHILDHLVSFHLKAVPYHIKKVLSVLRTILDNPIRKLFDFAVCFATVLVIHIIRRMKNCRKIVIQIYTSMFALSGTFETSFFFSSSTLIP